MDNAGEEDTAMLIERLKEEMRERIERLKEEMRERSLEENRILSLENQFICQITGCHVMLDVKQQP
jgi:hypothetical protein